MARGLLPFPGMPIASLLSAGIRGIDAFPIFVEVDINRGLPGWSTVGLPESAVREAKERVVSAIYNCGYDFPHRRITLNLAPADIKKQGSALDLPIAIGLLAAAELIPPEAFRDFLFLGELSLKGTLRPIRGTLSIALLAKRLGVKGLILPVENLPEARPVPGLSVRGAPDLPAVVEFLLGSLELPSAQEQSEPASISSSRAAPDFSEVKGQAFAKRALEVAAAGFHNILMVGPPGTGKSMLASRLPTILPPMIFEEQIQTTQIYSLVGLLPHGVSLVSERPFRSPHHTISDAGLTGGGTSPRPGEASLAHNGVLFLDELTEFKRPALESLRQPMENRWVTITRSQQSVTYPARFLLAAAMNPCPCGKLGQPQDPCFCPAPAVQRYQAKLSGPLLDRIDLRIEVAPVSFAALRDEEILESSSRIRARVQEAVGRQRSRLSESCLQFNGEMGAREIRKFCRIDSEGEKLLELAGKKWGFSARVYHRLLKVARTISDLEGKEQIETAHLAEALSYRVLDKK